MGQAIAPCPVLAAQNHLLPWRVQRSPKTSPAGNHNPCDLGPGDVPSPPSPALHPGAVGQDPARLGHPKTLWGSRNAVSTSWHGDAGTPSAGTFHAAGEASPVGKDQQREMLPVEVPDGLGCFESRVWKPDLPSLLDYLRKTASSSAETGAPSASWHTTLAGWGHVVCKSWKKNWPSTLDFIRLQGKSRYAKGLY